MKLVSKSVAAAFLIALMPLSALAQSADTTGTEGRVVGETIFASIDTAGRGTIHMGDIEQFRKSVFDGMDYNSDAKVTYEEFSGWDPGFAYVAEEAGRGDAYVTASKIVFAIWDRNGNGELTEPEMRLAMSADFRRADLDDDALLSRDEFIQGFLIMVAMRAALRPDL